MRRADAIAREIEGLILSGAIERGARLDEARLAERFAVSRTPIREALQALAAGGLVRHHPRRGVFVEHPSPVELLEMFETMAEWEAACGRLAARRIGGEALDALDAANERCRQAAGDGDAERYYLDNQAFHLRIYAEAGNGFLAAEATRLHLRLRPFRRAQLRLRGRMARSLDEHRAVAEALRAGDPVAAADALRDHVSVQGEAFQLLLREHLAA